MECLIFLVLICSSVTFIVSDRYSPSPVEIFPRPIGVLQPSAVAVQPPFMVANPLFVSNFYKALGNTERIEKIYEHALKFVKIPDALYDTELKYGSKFGVSDPVANAKLVRDTIESVSDVLTPASISKVVVSTVEHFLSDRGILTSENAAELSGKFARDLENIAVGQNVLKSPEEYLSALNEVVLNFLSPFQILTPGAADDLTKYFVQELKTLKG